MSRWEDAAEEDAAKAVCCGIRPADSRYGYDLDAYVVTGNRGTLRLTGDFTNHSPAVFCYLALVQSCSIGCGYRRALQAIRGWEDRLNTAYRLGGKAAVYALIPSALEANGFLTPSGSDEPPEESP